MATYYVRTDGNNGNTGLGQGSGQAWATVAYALGSTSTSGGAGLVAGDILYIAPGVYRGAITLGMASSASTISVIGDPLCTQFSGTSAGEVMLTVATSDSAVSTTTLISGTSKNFISWESIIFDNSTAAVGVNISGCQNWTFTKCTFSSPLFNQYTASNIQAAYAAGVIANLTIDRCSFFGGGCLLLLCTNHSSQTNVNVVIKDVYCIGPLLRFAGVSATSSTNAFGVTVFNCTTIHGGILAYSTITGAVTVQNCVLHALQGLESGASVTNITENYNRIYSNGPRSGVSTGANSVVGYHGLETLYKPQSGLPFSYLGANALNGPNYNSGNITGAPTFDFFSQNWTGANPDRGAVSWKQVSSITNYVPTERNASTITIAPGSTSQSIELYLGVTGLTASTSGLSARYNRTRTASVSITLVARTIAQAWTSGGFAEVDATNMPGVYRLDIPDAALIAGADDVTIVVRGASGTNGAVMTVTLIEEPTDAVLVRMGPFEVKADGLGASDPLDIQKGAQHGIDIQCVDAFGSGIDITSATVTAKVYNSGATLVDTYSCTATYAADGRATFEIDTTVTNAPGTYTATITRTTSASDTQIFGPLRIYVRDI